MSENLGGTGTFIDATTGILYRADPSRGNKLLSVTRFYLCWSVDASTSGGNLAWSGTALDGNDDHGGPRMLRAATILSSTIAGESVITDVFQIEVREISGGNPVIYTTGEMPISATGPISRIDTGINIDVNATDILIASGVPSQGTIEAPSFMLEMAWRTS